MNNQFRAYMELKIGRHWDYVIHILSFLQSFMAAYVVDRSDVLRLAAVVTELVENAVKYSADGRALLQVSTDNDLVYIEIENGADPWNIACLREEFAKIQDGTPSEAYHRKLLGGRQSSSKSLLGLARIRLESRDALRFVVGSDRIKAEVRFLLQRGEKNVNGQA
jgi:hypothetical protein